jgi:hypothetical protein
MKKAIWLMAVSLSAQSAPGIVEGSDWKALFNGQDLSGWVNVGVEKWEADHGTIHGMAVSKEYGYLRTEKDYKSFDLFMRFKCETLGNSGVFFRARFKPGTTEIVQGPQFEVDCTIGRHTGGVYDVGRAWIVWPAAENETVIRQGDWNEYLLQVHGNRFISRLNGVLMVDYTDPTPKGTEGSIALQLHAGGGAEMRFKDILIRDLSGH